MKKRLSHNEAAQRKIVKLRDKGLTFREIAVEVDYNRSTVRSFLLEIGYVPGETPKLKAPLSRAEKLGISEETQDKICQEYQEGKSGPALGKEYELWPHQVYALLRSRGVEIRKRGKSKGMEPEPVPEHVKDAMCSAYEAGVPVAEIAKEYKRGHNVLYAVLRERNILHRSAPNYKRDKEIARLYQEEGLTLQEVGDRFGISRERVRQILKKFGINRRRTVVKIEEKETMRQMHLGKGIPITHIAEIFGLPLKHVQKAMGGDTLSAMGRLLVQLGPEKVETIIRLYTEERWGTYRIGEEVDLPQPTVYKILKAKGIQMRPQKESMSKLTPEDKENLKELYKGGASLRRLAREFNITEGYVYILLKKWGVFERRGTKVTPELKEEMIQLRTQGLTCVQIAKKLGCSQNTVSRHTKGKVNTSEKT